jgi:hypothetical protein
MQFIAPDVLAEARGLSPVLCILGLILGTLLWLFGWRWNRFWTVLLATVMAGIVGLSKAPLYGSKPLLAGILFAIATGLLALSLVRLTAFFAGGVAASLLVQALGVKWGDPLISFLVGGLLGVVLFRVWTMALTGMAGAVLVGYSALCWADRAGRLDAVAWSDKETLLLNWACGVFTFLGLFAQLYLERRRGRKQKKKTRTAPEPLQVKNEPPPPRNWWQALSEKFSRRAA